MKGTKSMFELNSSTEKKIFYRGIFSLVLPMALQNLINVAVTSADVIMLGKVGETALSASSLAGQILFILTLILFGLTSGAAVLTAQYWGKKDIDSIEKILGISVQIAVGIALIFMAGALFIPRQLMLIFTPEEDVIAGGISYLRIIGFSYVFVALTTVYLNIMRTVERVLISTVVYVISLVVNVVLNAVFIFGLFGCPAMGVAGAALGTLVARIVEFLIVMFYSGRINRQVCLRMKYLVTRDKVLTKDFLKYATPVILNEMLWGGAMSTIAAIIGHMGSPMVAANSVAQVVRQLATVVTMGIANAAAIVLGKAIGEGKLEHAKVYGRRLVRLAIIMGIVGSIVITLLAPIIRTNLTLSVQAQEYLKMMLVVMSVFVIAQAYNCTLIVGVFRSGGDTKAGLIIDVATLWFVAIPFGAIAAFLLDWPPTAVYLLLTCDEFLKIVPATWRYRTNKWLRNVTR